LEIWNSSATASAIGKTVLDPSILMTLCATAGVGPPQAMSPPSTAAPASQFQTS
jgi:hypothetical protein